VSSLTFAKCDFSHFELLRHEAEKRGVLQIMEYFVYGISILNFGKARVKKLISIKGELSSIRKEKIYSAAFEGKTVYLCRKQLDKLGINKRKGK
jgi:hypothetical protein